MFDLTIIAGYAFLGAALKYIDEAYDENRFNKKIANISVVFCILIMGYLMVTDAPSMMIFIGMIVALIFAKKIDNIPFQSIVCGVMPLPLIFNVSPSIEMLPLSILILTGIMDEKGNDLADNKQIKGFLRKFFRYRCMMKVGVLGLCIFGIFHFIYFIAFMMFDLAYYLVHLYSTSATAINISPLSPVRYVVSLIKF